MTEIVISEPKITTNEIGTLVGALAKAQGTYKALIPNQDAAGGKFANLQAILAATRDSLSSNGLAFFQHIKLLDEGTGATLLVTLLAHESGQKIETVARILPEKTFRETFNRIEAYRRLSALLLLGIAPSDKDPLIWDDHGSEEQDKAVLDELKKPREKKERPSQFGDTITKDQYNEFMFDLEGYEEIAKSIQTSYDITSLADLPKDQYYVVKKEIKRLIKLHEQYKDV